MKTKNSILSLVILCIVVFAACKKTDNVPPLPPAVKALTGKIWKIKSLTVPKSTDPSQDSSIIESCADRALIAFDLSANYQFADGSNKGCDSSAVPYDKGAWGLSASYDTLFLEGKRNFAWKIETLNDSIVKATFHDSVSPTNNRIKKITLK